MLIKIIRDSIKENDNVGRTETLVPGKSCLSFKCSRLPDIFRGKVFISSQSDGTIEGTLSDSSLLKGLTEDDFKECGLSTNITRDVQLVRHGPIPKYSFEYENPDITCIYCSSTVSLDSLRSEYYPDYSVDQICPKCGKCGCVGEDIEYEKIEETIEPYGGDDG